MARFTRFGLVCVLIGGYLVVSGCGEADPLAPADPETPPAQVHDHDHDHHHDHAHDHDHHHDHAHAAHADSLAEAVSRLDELYVTIRDAMAVGDIQTAHGPLHRVGHVLEDVEGLAAAAPLSPDDREAVEEAIEELFAGYGAVDAQLHGRPGKDYAEVADEIDAAMETLRTVAARAEED